MLLDLNTLNYWAILAGGILYMFYGGIYYTVLVGKKNSNSGSLKYVVSVMVAFISSFFIAVLVQATGSNSLLGGALIGSIVGFLISLVYVKNTFFGLINTKNCAIAIGDHLIIFTLLGALHGFLG